MKKINEKDRITFSSFRRLIEHMVTRMGGYPVFIRTGQTSHKHQWAETCYVDQKKHINEKCSNNVGIQYYV